MIQKTKKIEELLLSGELSAADWDVYSNLQLTKHKYKNRLSVVGPTWLMRDPVKTIDDFIETMIDVDQGDSAKRDFACLPGGSRKPYFRNPLILEQNGDESRICPINDGSGVVGPGEEIYFDPTILTPNPSAFYCVAADLSISGDATGVAMVHFDIVSQQFVLDFSFQIAGKGVRIDYEPIRELIRTLSRTGFRIAYVAFDHFQSNDSLVILEKEGFLCEIVKFGDSLLGCDTVRKFVQTKKLLYGLCDKIFIGEAQELQQINDRKIDHLKSEGVHNSKDVWDAVVSAVVLAERVVRENCGEIIRKEDLCYFDYDSLFESCELSMEEKAYSAERIYREQLPNNGHALVVYVYCQFHSETNSEICCIAVGASDFQNRCKLLDVKSIRRVPERLVDDLVELEKYYQDYLFFRMDRKQSAEFVFPYLACKDSLHSLFYTKCPDLYIKWKGSDISETVRIKALQIAAKEGRVLFPEEPKASHETNATANDLVHYPFCPSKWKLLALEGLSRVCFEYDFTPSKNLSIIHKGIIGSYDR